MALAPGRFLHHSRLAQELAHLLGKDARLKVHPGAGCLRHDNAYRVVGVIVESLRAGYRAKQNYRTGERGK
jgi:hypothetical protein